MWRFWTEEDILAAARKPALQQVWDCLMQAAIEGVLVFAGFFIFKWGFVREAVWWGSMFFIGALVFNLALLDHVRRRGKLPLILEISRQK